MDICKIEARPPRTVPLNVLRAEGKRRAKLLMLLDGLPAGVRRRLMPGIQDALCLAPSAITDHAPSLARKMRPASVLRILRTLLSEKRRGNLDAELYTLGRLAPRRMPDKFIVPEDAALLILMAWKSGAKTYTEVHRLYTEAAKKKGWPEVSTRTITRTIKHSWVLHTQTTAARTVRTGHLAKKQAPRNKQRRSTVPRRSCVLCGFFSRRDGDLVDRNKRRECRHKDICEWRRDREFRRRQTVLLGM